MGQELYAIYGKSTIRNLISFAKGILKEGIPEGCRWCILHHMSSEVTIEGERTRWHRCYVTDETFIYSQWGNGADPHCTNLGVEKWLLEMV